MDKRLLSRVNVNDGNCILVKDGFFIGAIENISLGGLFVKSDIKVNVMDRIKVRIILSSDSGGIDMEADVAAIRVEDGGVALKFDYLGGSKFWTLQSYLRWLAGPSSSTH